jgi:hypothetical protein
MCYFVLRMWGYGAGCYGEPRTLHVGAAGILRTCRGDSTDGRLALSRVSRGVSGVERRVRFIKKCKTTSRRLLKLENIKYQPDPVGSSLGIE